MNARRYLLAQAVRGPVLLITLGTLFAIHQAGIQPFSRTWPLILIMLGVMKLIERMVAPPAPPYVPPQYSQAYGAGQFRTPPYTAPPAGPPPGGPRP
jgi:cell wall-active antibiotic response 4TMS protein YvqF